MLIYECPLVPWKMSVINESAVDCRVDERGHDEGLVMRISEEISSAQSQKGVRIVTTSRALH